MMLLYHIYTNNLSFFTETAFTLAPLKDAKEAHSLIRAIL